MIIDGVEPMALFEKKFCALCNEQVHALTRLKLSEGYLCSDCKKKLSDLSDGWSGRTINDVKEHLAARKANKDVFDSLSLTEKAGPGGELQADPVSGRFIFAFGRDYKEGNPEVFSASQLTDYWVEEDFSTHTEESDSNNNGGRVAFHQAAGVNAGGIMAPPVIQPYLRSKDSGFVSSGGTRYVSSIKCKFKINHRFITDVQFYADPAISYNNQTELLRAYTAAYQVMQLCDRLRGISQTAAQGFTAAPVYAQQPVNQGWQQPVNQGYQQPVNQGYQQPVNQGYQQPVNQGYQQPMNQGWQQPVNQGYQQPVNQGWQQPMGQGQQYDPQIRAAFLAFCPNCGTKRP